MDFSGCTGRVIENPNEVLTAALEEAQAWRKKTTHRYSLPTACHSSPLSAGETWDQCPVGVPASGRGSPKPDTPLPTAIHRTQPWFHGRISREDTQQLIGRQGLVDGYGTLGW
ncbi:GRB7 protein, partial [Buphagus erythrorhynchus]|nr:GRB7 protein [Buphagus erythrorhynchus]